MGLYKQELTMDKLLLIEDDMPLAMATSFAIETEGFEVTHVTTLKEAGAKLNSDSFSLVLLDANLPDGDGYTFCKDIREQGFTLPVIFLTALDQEVNVIQGLEVGADDYVTKPFRVRELISRIKANIRRSQVNSSIGEVMVFGAFRIDLAGHKITKDGENINGNRVKVKVVKNKVAPPFKKAEFDILYGEGISLTGEIIDLGVEMGVIKKSGSWFSYNETKLGQGRDALKRLLDENPELCDELYAKIMDALNNSNQDI